MRRFQTVIAIIFETRHNANVRVLMKRHNVARVSDAGLLPAHAQPFLDSG